MPRDFADVFDGRLGALKGADGLCSSQGARLIGLLDYELMAAGGNASRFALEGPDVVLPPDCVFALSLLIHELAANAERHGSFSVPGGRVDIAWHLEGSDLLMTWTESGGPPARRPLSPGMGTLLISDAALKLHGTVDHLYKQTGLVCHLRVSLCASWPHRRSAMRLDSSAAKAAHAM